MQKIECEAGRGENGCIPISERQIIRETSYLRLSKAWRSCKGETIHPITSERPIHSLCMEQATFCWTRMGRGEEGRERVKWTGKAEVRTAESLAVGEACKATY